MIWGNQSLDIFELQKKCNLYIRIKRVYVLSFNLFLLSDHLYFPVLESVLKDGSNVLLDQVKPGTNPSTPLLNFMVGKYCLTPGYEREKINFDKQNSVTVSD